MLKKEIIDFLPFFRICSFSTFSVSNPFQMHLFSNNNNRKDSYIYLEISNPIQNYCNRQEMSPNDRFRTISCHKFLITEGIVKWLIHRQTSNNRTIRCFSENDMKLNFQLTFNSIRLETNPHLFSSRLTMEKFVVAISD